MRWNMPTTIPFEETMLTTGPANPQEIAMKRKISAKQRMKAAKK